MSLNDNEIFYRKLLWRIVTVLCLLFVLMLNVMRYQTLMLHTLPKTKVVKEQKDYRFSVFFTPLNETKHPKMIFLSDAQNKKYLASVFSFLKIREPDNIILINCAEKEPVVLKKFLQGYKIIEALCRIEQENLETMLSNGYNIVVINTDGKFLHRSALRAAEQLGLKPSLKITEIKNAGKRLSN